MRIYEIARAMVPVWLRSWTGRELKVRRCVYEAAKRLEAEDEAHPELCAWSLGLTIIEKCKNAGDKEKVRFWREVFACIAYADWHCEEPEKQAVRVIEG